MIRANDGIRDINAKTIQIPYFSSRSRPTVSILAGRGNSHTAVTVHNWDTNVVAYKKNGAAGFD